MDEEFIVYSPIRNSSDLIVFTSSKQLWLNLILLIREERIKGRSLDVCFVAWLLRLRYWSKPMRTMY